jgi:DNA-directed RNA polymerase sigma subunit (sigma70/sigma32)
MFGINTPAKKRDEIAYALGYSLEGIRLIEERSMEKLRNNEKAMQLLAKYLS